MNDRNETVEAAAFSGTRSDSGPQTCLQHVKVANREDARKGGLICGRSRSFMNNPG